MEQSEVIEILTRHVFKEDKAALLRTLAENPDRFIGIFRSTTPRLKLMQNILQSREIRFGDAMEEIVASLLQDMQYINLDKRFLTAKNEKLACDQYFCARDHQLYYLMEQKVRDDHDSTKKRRQIVNFRAKLVHLKVIHGKSLTGIMYFIDPALHKNTGYYQQEVIALRQELEIPIHLFYNGELFQFLQGHTETWDFLVNSLNFWRVSVPEKIELDYDADSSKTIAELTAISGSIWYKRITNDALWTSGVIASLFATGETLRHFEGVLRQKGEQRFQSGKDSITFQFLADLLKQRLLVYYPNVSL